MSKYKNLLSIAIISACFLLIINFGLRSSLGFFLKPISDTFGYGREIFALSLALQNLCWGLFQPLAGAYCDKFGIRKTVFFGSVLYALGLFITANADGVFDLHIGAGIFVGMGIAGTGLGVVLPVMARMVRPERRAFALGLGTAAGSAGQFLLIPVAQSFLSVYGWQTALLIMAIGAFSMILFSAPIAEENSAESTQIESPDQTLKEALKEAFSHTHYWLLIAGFFVCGFQLAFITAHMPSYLADMGFDGSVAAISLSLIGLFNIFGSLIAGQMSGIYSKKWLLGYIYLARAIAIVIFLVFHVVLQLPTYCKQNHAYSH